MNIDGAIPNGKYTLTRSMSMLDNIFVYSMNVGKNIEIFCNDKNITEEITHLDFKKNNIVFLWRKPSKVGLPFKITDVVKD